MATLEDILIKLNKLNKLDDISESIQHVSTICNDIIAKQEILELRLNQLDFENIQLKQKVETITNELECIKQQHIKQNNHTHYSERINKSIDRIKQQTLNSNLEIAGVPEFDNDSPKQIALGILQKLGFTEDNIIKSAYRRKSKNTTAGLPKNIIVSISNKGQRDQILAESRKITNLNTTILEQNYISQYKPKYQSTNNTILATDTNSNIRPIYINEHLTDFNKYLLARSKSLRRSGKVVLVYVRNGFVILKVKDNSSEIRIETIRQLDELLIELNRQSEH